LPFHEPPETYSTSEHLYLELDIPTDVGSTLPRADRTRAGLAAEELEDLGGRDAKTRRRAPAGRPERSERSDRPERSERPDRPRRDRTRVRTRGGQPLTPGDSGPSESPAEAGDGAAPKRRVRRRRGGGGGGESKTSPAAE